MKPAKTPSHSYQKIWRTVEKIPYGRVATYGHVARVSRLAGQARLVGYALHNLPRGVNVPWHRVINSQGRISFPENSPSYKRQRELLEMEGVVFVRGRVNLNSFCWKK